MSSPYTAAQGRAAAVPTPKVSVCMITYNQEEFIAEAIESALAQRTHFPFEIVIGDDCSTDRTPEIVEGYRQRFPDTITVVRSPVNVGHMKNFWQTLARCRGTYVALLEGDDYWTDVDKIQLQADLLDQTPGAFVCGARVHAWRMGEPAPYAVMPSESSELLATYGSRELFYGQWWFRSCTNMCPRELLMRIPPRFHRDWAAMLWQIAATNFGDVCFLDRVVAVYREHPAGVFSLRDRARRAMTDVETLAKTIPLFLGEERHHLEHVMTLSVDTILQTDGLPRASYLRYAMMAVTACPAAGVSWRNLARAFRRTLDFRSVTPLI
jgi:glycosyltransferase involved in cell wall biosynthesis